MLIPLSWLKDFINIKTSAKEIASNLTLLGHEVEQLLPGDIIDCDITPNRGDCLSIVGLARELAAFKNFGIDLTKFESEPRFTLKTDLPKLEFEDKKLCPIYAFVILEGFKIIESPDWMKKRLTSCNIKPINNIVDITNYVMLETGQPLHAFDLDKIQGRRMMIRKAKKGETITTLDGKIRKLNPKALVIQDSKKLIDLAGIMGGQTSEVDHDTKRIFLQAAIFSPSTIRHSSKTLQISTDASSRYERGIDAENLEKYLLYAAKLFQELCQAKLSKPKVIVNQKITSLKISFSHQEINKLIDTNISNEKMDEILQRLGIRIDKNFASVPGWRAFDITIWQDLAEEVARIYGYNKLSTKPLKPKKPANYNQTYFAIEKIKDTLSKLGYIQTENYSFVSSRDLENTEFNKNYCTKITNPVSELNEYLRPSLKIGLLESIANNPFVPIQKLFEIGKVFSKNSETFHLAIASTDTTSTQSNFNGFKKQLKLAVGDGFEKIPLAIQEKFKIKRQVYYKEFDITETLKKIDVQNYQPKLTEKKVFKLYPKLPPVTRDLSFIVQTDTDSLDVSTYIQKSNPLILSVELFDEFVSDKFGKNKKNIAFHILIQPTKETLKDSQINVIIDKIVNEVEKKFGAKLRGTV